MPTSSAGELGLDPDDAAAIRASPACSTTSARSGSRTRSCASPGRLTDEEYAIVKQHVALGDAIVRDLPDIDLIRAGVRHHHERWDGNGYLDGLAGEEIPLVARILAVGDAFSAMTTTRPYRKALASRRRSAGSRTPPAASSRSASSSPSSTASKRGCAAAGRRGRPRLWTPSSRVA